MIKNRERKMFEFITVRELYELYINDRDQLDGIEYVELQGWIRTNRNSGKIGFLALNDGTYFKNVQVVYLDEIIDNYEEASHISTGSAVKVTGKLKLTPDGKQPFEIEATHLVVEGTCDEDFPLQKKRHSFEYMREIPHLRPRANTFYAIFRLRSVLSMAIHEFFQTKDSFMSIHQSLLQMMVKVLEKCLEQQQSIILNLIKISLEKKLILQLQDNYMLKLLL